MILLLVTSSMGFPPDGFITSEKRGNEGDQITRITDPQTMLLTMQPKMSKPQTHCPTFYTAHKVPSSPILPNCSGPPPTALPNYNGSSFYFIHVQPTYYRQPACPPPPPGWEQLMPSANRSSNWVGVVWASPDGHNQGILGSGPAQRQMYSPTSSAIVVAAQDAPEPNSGRKLEEIDWGG